MTSKPSKRTRRSEREEWLRLMEKETPEISEALRIFDMTMEQYSAILSSLYPSITYSSNSTCARGE